MADEQLWKASGSMRSGFLSPALRASDLMFVEKQCELDAATAKLDELSQQLNQMFTDKSAPQQGGGMQEAKSCKRDLGSYSSSEQLNVKDHAPVYSANTSTIPNGKSDHRSNQSHSDTTSSSLSTQMWTYPSTNLSDRLTSPESFSQVVQSSPAHQIRYPQNEFLAPPSQKDRCPSPRPLLQPASSPEQSFTQRPSSSSYDTLTCGPPSRTLPSDTYIKPVGLSAESHSSRPESTFSYESLTVPAYLGRPSSPWKPGSPSPGGIRTSFSSERLSSGWPEAPSPGSMYPAKAKDDLFVRRKPQAHWGESDLDVVIEKKPLQSSSYDRASMGYRSGPPGVQLPKWKESDLDAAVLSSKDESHRLKETSFRNATLPKGFRTGPVPQTEKWQEQPYFWGQTSTGTVPRNWQPSQQPISRIPVPPGSPQRMLKRNPQRIPLSVIFQLQSAHSPNRSFSLKSDTQSSADGLSGWIKEQTQRLGKARHCGTSVVHETAIGAPNPAELGEVEPELESIFPASDSSDTDQIPRPLSPTRLQPVLPPVLLPEVKEVTDIEEIKRIRAEIPRALKRRSSLEQPQIIVTPVQKKQYQQIINKLFRRSRHKHDADLGSDPLPSIPVKEPEMSFINEKDETTSTPCQFVEIPITQPQEGQSSLKKPKYKRGPKKHARLHPLVLLLDAALIGELDIVQQVVREMNDPSMPNDEGITALHNAICGSNYSIVEFLISVGANVNAMDSHGWTPLHCAASCNDMRMCVCLVKHGAAVFSTTISDNATAAEKCDPYTEGYEECLNYLLEVEQTMGIANNGVVYAVWDCISENEDELSFREGEAVTILHRDDTNETEWWLAALYGREGFVPRNYFGLFPKVKPRRNQP